MKSKRGRLPLFWQRGGKYISLTLDRKQDAVDRNQDAVFFSPMHENNTVDAQSSFLLRITTRCCFHFTPRSVFPWSGRSCYCTSTENPELSSSQTPGVQEESAEGPVQGDRTGDIPVSDRLLADRLRGPSSVGNHQGRGRVSLVRVTAMRLEGLRLEDQGLYECRILLLDKPADELHNGTWTLLSVTAPPAFTEAPPPEVEALVGGRLSLPCVATGNPAPTITWLKDGSVIQRTDDREGALSLRAVSMQSAGRYTCHASNSEGNMTRVTKVKIKGPPVIVIPPQSTSLNMSQNALLRCQAVADPPNMTYVWQRGGENVHHIESLKTRVKIMVDGTLLISGLVPEDSGNYTCAPTNGLLTPPTASANLTVMHPARALPMPRETYLPTGMRGVVTCPAAAQPPLLRVDWTKDGEPLDLLLYPGWTLTPEGSLFMATVNDDAAGAYTCTPHNSYGSAGASGPTAVILQDPPSFSVPPEEQYRQEAGRTLLIPCEGNEDPTTKVTWSKVDLARRISYSVEPNGSLLLQPLTKDHQGAWECSAANRVASVKASTLVFVLGTSPHPAASLSVSPGVRQANVSWEAGFDGGSAQTFSVWVKKISASDNEEGKQAWFSVPVPSSSGARLQVTGLSAATDYQFSVLSHNRMGTGPFSEFATARTLDPPLGRSKPRPPASLSANQGPAGVLLRWSLPDAQRPAIDGFVLQSRTRPGEWFNLVEDVGANSSEIVVPGLHKTGRFSPSDESRHRQTHLPSDSARGRLTRTTSSPISPPIELISRGADGRFALPPYDADTLSVHSGKSARYLQAGRVRRSVSLHAGGEDRKERPFVLSVDLPPREPADATSPSRVLHLPHPNAYVLDPQASCDGFPDLRSLNSYSSLDTIPHRERTPAFPVLPHIRSGLAQRATTASALVLQMEHERERGNLSRCLTLAQEREELERELQKYMLERGSAREIKREQADSELREDGDDVFVWEYKSTTLPHRHPQGNKTSLALSSSPSSSSSVHWDARPLVSPRLGASCFKSGYQHFAPSLTKQAPLRSEGAGGFSKDRLTLPHLPAKHQRHERVEAAPEGYNNSPQSTVLEMQRSDSRCEARRQSSLSHGSLSTPSLHCHEYTESSNSALGAASHSANAEASSRGPADEGACAEMSVDEPELEVRVTRPPRPMLHQRIASHVQQGRPLTPRGHFEDTGRSAGFNCRTPASVGRVVRVPAPPQAPGPEPRRAAAKGSQLWDSKQRSRSLDSRRRNESGFPPPDDWIESLSQENCSAASSRHADTLFWEPQSSPTTKISKSPARSPSAAQAASPSPPAVDTSSATRGPERPVPNPAVPCQHEPRGEILPYAAKWPISYRQEATKDAEGYSEAAKEASRCAPPDDGHHGVLDVEAAEGELESGSSYNSYASSGRGSMEPANGRLSMCHLSPTLASSPESVEGSQGGADDKQSHRMDPSQRRKASVDENYEWDADDDYPQAGDRDGLLLPLDPLKPPPPPHPPLPRCRGLPSVPRSAEERTRLSWHPGHRSSFSAEPEPDTVLF
ncbi:hypothetical protein F2P81_015709 [Scophthalmus maximus]|uniref:Uncharacterized protein n=1 Tax=Scophthalmus maximus TaxID=52904 RepID=A0A6A4SJJ8_SCOMX|nr:hypothetical protein F2P81_015709 [Scophthalmus maximus]